MQLKISRAIAPAVMGAMALAMAAPAWADAPVATPDLIWYTFEESAGSGTTENLASPGAGFANAPVNGHTLGGGSLTSIGGSSTNNFVDTGWDGATGTGSFSVYLELTNPAVGNTALEYFFGTSPIGSRAFDDGVAGGENIAFRFGGGDFATAFGATTPGATREVAFVFDTDVDEGYAYVDGVLVDTVTGLNTVNVTAGQFKVGGYWNSSAMQAGTQLHDFRVYGRPLDASELVPEPALGSLLIPGLLLLRRKRA